MVDNSRQGVYGTCVHDVLIGECCQDCLKWANLPTYTKTVLNQESPAPTPAAESVSAEQMARTFLLNELTENMKTDVAVLARKFRFYASLRVSQATRELREALEGLWPYIHEEDMEYGELSPFKVAWLKCEAALQHSAEAGKRKP